MTDGEFVVIFDADHVAETHFIDRLIGYFGDDRLGFVQTPHAFYNFDAFQGVLDYKRKVYWEEGMLFYNVTQPGKNRWNGVTFCGSAAMFRRKSLEEVGLIATQSITEDMHTGLRMHAKGWKSLFVNERLIAAIAADDVTSFNTQRLRRGEGNLGIFAFDNPITIRGLTIAQRLCYLGSMLSWTTGVQKLLIYSTPVAMLLTSISPVLDDLAIARDHDPVPDYDLVGGEDRLRRVRSSDGDRVDADGLLLDASALDVAGRFQTQTRRRSSSPPSAAGSRTAF